MAGSRSRRQRRGPIRGLLVEEESPKKRNFGLLIDIDRLVFPPQAIYKQIISTRNYCGGIATIMIPLIMMSIFVVIFLQNNAIVDVSQGSSRNLASNAALKLSVSCITADIKGNANPFCPVVSDASIPYPAGFQFVPTIDDTFCQKSISRITNRTVSQAWLTSDVTDPTGYSSPALLSLEKTLGIPDSDIASGVDPFQLVKFVELASDMSLTPQVR